MFILDNVLNGDRCEVLCPDRDTTDERAYRRLKQLMENDILGFDINYFPRLIAICREWIHSPSNHSIVVDINNGEAFFLTNMDAASWTSQCPHFYRVPLDEEIDSFVPDSVYLALSVLTSVLTKDIDAVFNKIDDDNLPISSYGEEALKLTEEDSDMILPYSGCEALGVYETLWHTERGFKSLYSAVAYWKENSSTEIYIAYEDGRPLIMRSVDFLGESEDEEPPKIIVYNDRSYVNCSIDRCYSLLDADNILLYMLCYFVGNVF